MAMEYFCYFHSYGKKTERLSDQELGRLVRALCVYSETGERQELTGRESLAFDFMAEDIDRAKEAYKKKCDTNRHNVERRYTTVDDGNERIPSPTKSTKDKNKQKEKENQKEYTGDIGASPQRTRKAFIPPTPSDVRAYCLEHGYAVDAERFCDYYQKQGWKLSNGLPIRDWQACVRTWARRDQERGVQARPQSSNIFADMAREGVFEDESSGSL